MMTPRAVPWLDWAEWEAVRELLIAPEPERRARGVQRVAAWRSRGRLPVSVETTACLVEIWLSERGAQPPSEVQLRLAYSMALLRMVNGICDPSQRGKAASSVLTLARRLGLPPMLVDLRHAATHGSLPALPALQLGASQAMEWLLEKYWRQQHEQAEALESDDRELAVQREATSALKRYRKWREGAMQKQLDQGQELTNINQDDTTAAETRRCADVLAGPTAVVPDDAIVEAFLDGNMLVPKAEDETAAAEEVASLPWVRSEVDGVFTRLRCLWRPVVAAVRQRRPRIRAALLYGVIERLSAEGGGLDLKLSEQDTIPETSTQSISTQQRLRLGLLQRWARFLVSTDQRLWPALQSSVTQISTRTQTCALELDRSEAIARCLRGMNEWLTPLLGELRRPQQDEQAQKEYHSKIAKLAAFGCTISSLQRDPVGAVTQLQSIQATQSVSATPAGHTQSAAPVLASYESVATQLKRWSTQSAEKRRRLQTEAEAGRDVTRGAGETLEGANGANEQNSYGLWYIPRGYKPASIGAPTPHVANSASRDDASDMTEHNIGVEHMASLELPDFINEVSLYAAMPSPITPAAASTSVDSGGQDPANVPTREYSGSYHVAGEDDPMGVDATGWDSHGYSLPAPVAFDGSQTVTTAELSTSRSVNGEAARLLSTEDINLHCANTMLVECL